MTETVEDDHTDGNSSPPSLTSTQQVVTVTELTSSRRNGKKYVLN